MSFGDIWKRYHNRLENKCAERLWYLFFKSVLLMFGTADGLPGNFRVDDSKDNKAKGYLDVILQIITKIVQFMQEIPIGKHFLINWRRGIYSKKNVC